MPLYQNEQADTVTVEFGPHASLTFKLRPDGASVASARQILRQQKQASYNEKRIKMLERKLEQEDLPATEFDSITKELEDLNQRPDQLNLLTEYILSIATDWTDNYESKAHEERGERIPFNKENLELLGAPRLVKIMEAINEHFGYKPEEGKGSPAN